MIYKHNKIPWKEVKERWNQNPLGFVLKFWHKGKLIGLESGIGSNKQIKIVVFIDGVLNGSYTNKDNPNHIYMNEKVLRLSSKDKETTALINKLRKKVKLKLISQETPKYLSPIFSNVAQIKRMVDKLP